MNDAAPASGYAEAYAAWRADPQSLVGGGRRGHHLGPDAGTACSIPRWARMAAGSRAAC